jgi:hypothetical protein
MEVKHERSPKSNPGTAWKLALTPPESADLTCCDG